MNSPVVAFAPFVSFFFPLSFSFALSLTWIPFVLLACMRVTYAWRPCWYFHGVSMYVRVLACLCVYTSHSFLTQSHLSFASVASTLPITWKPTLFGVSYLWRRTYIFLSKLPFYNNNNSDSNNGTAVESTTQMPGIWTVGPRARKRKRTRSSIAVLLLLLLFVSHYVTFRFVLVSFHRSFVLSFVRSFVRSFLRSICTGDQIVFSLYY